MRPSLCEHCQDIETPRAYCRTYPITCRDQLEIWQDAIGECARICEEAAKEQEGFLRSHQEATFTPGVCRKLAELMWELAGLDT